MTKRKLFDIIFIVRRNRNLGVFVVIAIINTKLYTVEDLVDMLNISDKTVRAYLREGKIKARKIGLRWRVTEENLKKFLEGGDNK
ncbi:hypothetical protein ES702_03104 [subsurface metagenome]